MLDAVWIERTAALAAAAPGLALLYALHLRAGLRHLREPMWIAFGLGFCLFAPVIIAEIAIGLAESAIGDPRLYGLVDAFLGAAVPEEMAKILVLIFIMLRHEDLARPIDAVPLALAIALGFASIENMFMVVDAPDWGITAATRAAVAIPGHALYGLMMGFFATRYLSNRRRRDLAAMAAVPIALHGLYDLPLLTIDRAGAVGLPIEALPLWPYVGLFVVTLVGFISLAWLALRTLHRTPAFHAPRAVQRDIADSRLAAVFD